MRLIFTLCLLLFVAGNAYPQDSLLYRMAAEHSTYLNYNSEEMEFSGPGWEQITDRVREAQHVLIGEDHFTREIPAFTSSIMSIGNFENFVIEVDPYSTEIIENSIREKSPAEREKFNAHYSRFFSFYALEMEYELLEQAIANNANLLGAEQIVKYTDQLILQELAKRASSSAASEMFDSMSETSAEHFDRFQSDRNHPLYFTKSAFGESLNKLDTLSLSDSERSIIRDMKISREIYKNNDHVKRIGLMKRILLDSLETWKNSRNLFKYGAVHMTRGESLLRIYDVGNLVSNVADAEFAESYHIMIFGKSGMKGAPFPNYPNTPVDASKGMLSNMAPLFDAMQDDSDRWHAFDMEPLREALSAGQLQIGNKFLERVIKGYDTVVVIPEVTAAGF